MGSKAYPGRKEHRYAPADCGPHANVLNKAILRLESAGIRISEHSRLRRHTTFLARVAETGSFPTTESEQHRLANALSDAAEIDLIVQTLPSTFTPLELGELRELAGGTPEHAPNEPALRYQAQWWLRSVLAMGGYDPQTPTSARESPDYLVYEGTLSYGVEVKRPGTLRGALELIAKGARQLRSQAVRGAIILDISDVVRTDELRWLPDNRLLPAGLIFEQQLKGISDRVGNQIFDSAGRTLRIGYESVMCILYVAKGWTWIQGESPELVLFAGARLQTFYPRIKNLIHHRTVMLAKKLVRGIVGAGYDFPLNDDVWLPRLHT